MVSGSALLIFPCTTKSRTSLLAPAHPGCPGKGPKNGRGGNPNRNCVYNKNSNRCSAQNVDNMDICLWFSEVTSVASCPYCPYLSLCSIMTASVSDSHPVYLGITLDRMLSYKEHLQKTASKLKSRNNLLMKLAGSSWGTNAGTLKSSAMDLCYSAAE